jgi:hypothetical protein
MGYSIFRFDSVKDRLTPCSNIVLCINRYNLNLPSIRPEPFGFAQENPVIRHTHHDREGGRRRAGLGREGGNIRPFDKLRANGWGLHRHFQWQSPGERGFIAN